MEEEGEGITTHMAVNEKTTLSPYTSKVRERCDAWQGKEKGKEQRQGQGSGTIHLGEGREIYYLRGGVKGKTRHLYIKGRGNGRWS